jgi:REP element-mobilizing transposase RayT
MNPSHNPKQKHRRSTRLKGYDYTQPGAYFVTICTYQREPLFGQVITGQVELSEYGQIVQGEWLKSPAIREEIELDQFVIMPNHLHGIVNIVPVGAKGPLPPSPKTKDSLHSSKSSWQGPVPTSLGSFISGFKSAVTKQINQSRQTPGQPVWQRNYYEHIIRSDRALDAIRQYIDQNPARWDLDRYNPIATGPDPQALALWELLQSNVQR